MVATLVGYAGCAHGVKSENVFTQEEWLHALTKNGLDPDTIVYPFDVTPDMQAWVNDVILRGNTRWTATAKLEALQQAMFDREFDFNYDDGLTLTADQAFDLRRGNCMSFTALFVALSRAAGVETFLMSVRRTPQVNKEDDLLVVNHHVVAAHKAPNDLLVFDFYLASEEPFFRQRIVDDVLATAMYHNNIGGLAIRNDDLEVALRNLEVTTRLAPDWPPGWVNLGVARYRSGDSDGALEAYGAALEVDPDQPSALTNMAYVYRELGWKSEADAILSVAASRSSHPFTLIALAHAEMLRGNYEKSEEHLRKARRKYRDVPELWEAMARLARYENDLESAERYLAKAEKMRKKQSKRSGQTAQWPTPTTTSTLPPR